MFRPIYEPRTKAKEYCDRAVNIYTGCNHGCIYCYAPNVLRKNIEDFKNVAPRADVVESVKKQLAREGMKDKKIMLCFTCDPYPAEIDTMPTREVIAAIKDSGNHVQILTKGGFRAIRDFDLLDKDDSFGVTYSGCKEGELFNKSPEEPKAAPNSERLATLAKAKRLGIKTWMSCEPVLYAEDIYTILQLVDYVDLFRIGKLNYRPSDIDWCEFGRNCERICKAYHRNYYIKEDLRKEMERNA
jgi:DNA repair photolyase